MLVKVSKELHEQKKYHGMINLGAAGELEHDVTDAAEVVAWFYFSISSILSLTQIIKIWNK